jgi:hypothetical protein
MWRTSGLGGGAPANNSHQMAAPKQNPLNRISTVPTPITSQCPSAPANKVRAPTPLASAARPVRIQAA